MKKERKTSSERGSKEPNFAIKEEEKKGRIELESAKDQGAG